MAARRKRRQSESGFLRFAFAGRAGKGGASRRVRGKGRNGNRAWPYLIVALAIGLAAARYFGLPERITREMAPPPAARHFDIVGAARVSDGDTLRIGNTRIRLSAIDAPELSQKCTLKTASPAAILCGEAAASTLRNWAQGAQVGCTAEGRDRYGRTLATCYGPDGTDLNRAMVQAGWALAYRRYSDRYAGDEAAAAAAGIGLWATDFVSPEDYRRAAAR